MLLLGCSGFSMVFAALGAFVLPMWIPLLGEVVVTFTLVLPSECGGGAPCAACACAGRKQLWWQCSVEVSLLSSSPS
jgi:hypothetical protein